MATTPYHLRRRAAVRAAYRRRGFCVSDLWREDEDNFCGICRSVISDRRTASIDHIVPLIQGGTETIGNVQLAHQACNSAKGVAERPARPHAGVLPAITNQCLAERCRECDGVALSTIGTPVRCACICHRATAWPLW